MNHCTLPGCETVIIQVVGVPTVTATTAATLESTATTTLEATQVPSETPEPTTAVPSETPVETPIRSLTPITAYTYDEANQAIERQRPLDTPFGRRASLDLYL